MGCTSIAGYIYLAHKVLGHARCRHVVSIVFPIDATSHAGCRWLEGGTIVTGGEAVWNNFVFLYLLRRYLVIEASIDGQWIW